MKVSKFSELEPWLLEENISKFGSDYPTGDAKRGRIYIEEIFVKNRY